jgi:Archaeal TRASH domain
MGRLEWVKGSPNWESADRVPSRRSGSRCRDLQALENRCTTLRAGPLAAPTLKPMKTLSLILLVGAMSLFVQSNAAEPVAKPATPTTAPAKLIKYPLKDCLISDEKLDSMGEPFVFKHQDREVKLCCKSCKKDFDKNPKKFLKKLNDLEKKLKK